MKVERIYCIVFFAAHVVIAYCFGCRWVGTRRIPSLVSGRWATEANAHFPETMLAARPCCEGERCTTGRLFT